MVALGTTFSVPGALALLFGFSAANEDPMLCGVQIPYLERIGHGMTGMLLFVVGFVSLVIGLMLFWFTRRIGDVADPQPATRVAPGDSAAEP